MQKNTYSTRDRIDFIQLWANRKSAIGYLCVLAAKILCSGLKFNIMAVSLIILYYGALFCPLVSLHFSLPGCLEAINITAVPLLYIHFLILMIYRHTGTIWVILNSYMYGDNGDVIKRFPSCFSPSSDVHKVH